MIFPTITTQVRPNRLERTKDEQYHVDYARWCVGVQSNFSYQNFIQKTLVNWNFYQNNQWIFDEDLTHFLLDESGEARHRIKLSRNLIRRVVEFYRGMAIDMKFSVKAQNVSPFTIERKQNDLHRLKYLSYVSKKAPAFSKMMESTLPVGRDEHEVNEIHDSIYTDEVQDMSNDFLSFVKDDVKIDRIKNELAKYLALSGLSVYKGFEYNGRYKADAINPLFFFFDMNAKRSDLKDAAYMGENHFWDSSTIFERFQNINPEHRKAIEKWSTSQYSPQYAQYYNVLYSLMGWSSNNVPVSETYWNDCEKKEYGWVLDNMNYPMFCLINDPSSPYKNKDLVTPPEEFQKKYKMKHGKLPEKRETVYIDIVRYCTFIPGEYIGTVKTRGKNNDIVLEYGVVPYQDKNSFNISEAVYPYKCGTWSYHMGNISSPIDDLIDTQRLQNRLLSAAEGIINNSGSSGTIVEKEAAADDPEGEAGIESKLKRGKTVFIDSKGKGLTNAVSGYDNTLKASVNQMFGIVAELGGSIDGITGINPAISGLQGGSGQSSGATQSHVQQGTILLQPFFQTIREVLEDASDDMLTVGMKIYADNPRQLAIIAGEKGAQIIRITKEMRLEDYRLFLHWDNDPSQSKMDINGFLVQALSMQLIDREIFDKLFNRADMDAVARGIREYGQKVKLANIEQKRQEPAKNQMIEQQMEKAKEEAKGEQRRQEMRQDTENEENRQSKLHQIILRGKTQIQRDRARNDKKKGK